MICTSSGLLPTYLQHFWKALLQQGICLEHSVLQWPASRLHVVDGWGTLKTLPDLLDLTGVQVAHMPHILTDLRHVQRPVSRTPLFLVNHLDLVTQRLIASSDVPGVLCRADALVAHVLPHLTDLLHQPHAIGTSRPWFGLMPPAAAQVIAPETIPLLAALTCVTSQTAAGDLCGISRSTVQRLLLELQITLDLPPARHRCPYDWVSLVLDRLAQVDLCPVSQG